MTDWGRLYRDNVEALTALAGDLRDDQLATHVPATPAWTVRDVYAHLAGGPADALSGRMDGAPGPEWTSRHVGERARLPLDVLVAEIRSQQDAAAPRMLQRAGVTVRCGGQVLGDPDAEPAVEVSAYELYRAIFSRRSRR